MIHIVKIVLVVIHIKTRYESYLITLTHEKIMVNVFHQKLLVFKLKKLEVRLSINHFSHISRKKIKFKKKNNFVF